MFKIEVTFLTMLETSLQPLKGSRRKPTCLLCQSEMETVLVELRKTQYFFLSLSPSLNLSVILVSLLFLLPSYRIKAKRCQT